MILKPYLTDNSFSRASSGGTSPQSPDRWRSSSVGKRSSFALLSKPRAPGVATRRPRGKSDPDIRTAPVDRREDLLKLRHANALPAPPRQHLEPGGAVAPDCGEPAPTAPP